MNAIARFNRSIWIAQLGVISVIAAATTAQQARFTVREIVTQPRGWGSTWHAKLLDDGTVVRSGSRDGVAVAQIGSAEPIEFPSFSTAWQWQANPLSVDHFFTLSGSPAGKAIARVTTVGTVVISLVPDLSAVSVQCVRADGWPVATWALPSPDAIGASVAFNEREVEELQAPAGVARTRSIKSLPTETRSRGASRAGVMCSTCATTERAARRRLRCASTARQAVTSRWVGSIDKVTRWQLN